MATTTPPDDLEERIYYVRLMIGDTPTSPFYPIFQDEEISAMLAANNWNVRRTIRVAAIAALMQFVQMTYRERTGDIEVWNNVSLQYQKALQSLIDDKSIGAISTGVMPYFGGISWTDVIDKTADRDTVRSVTTWEKHGLRQLGGASHEDLCFLQRYSHFIAPGTVIIVDPSP